GVQFRPITDQQRERFKLETGATFLKQVYLDGPAAEDALQTGDFGLGHAVAHFTEPNQLREWTMPSPRDTPLPLDAVREGDELHVTVYLAPFPAELPSLPNPPTAGDEAPNLGSLRRVRPEGPPPDDLADRRHML